MHAQPICSCLSLIVVETTTYGCFSADISFILVEMSVHYFSIVALKVALREFAYRQYQCDDAPYLCDHGQIPCEAGRLPCDH